MAEEKVAITFKTDPAVKDRLNDMAKERAVSVSALINLAIFNYFQYTEAKKHWNEIKAKQDSEL